MATATRYTVSFLRSIRLKARDRDNYENFFIPVPVHSWIIALGVKLQPRPYRRSRGCQNQFFKIVSVVNRMHSHHNHSNCYVNSDNLCSIKCCAKTAPIKSMSTIFDCWCGMVNCRSIVNKTNEIKLEIINKTLDICALTETWLCEQDKNFLTICSCPPGYRAISTPWLDCRGGGIGLIYRNSINICLNSSYNFQSKECADFKINLDWTPYLLTIVYRPPNTSVLQLAMEWAEYMKQTINISGWKLTVGDFNIHVNNTSDSNTITFMDMLQSFHRIDQVSFMIHNSNNTLDLVIIKLDATFLWNVGQGHMVSDHYMVLFDIKICHTVTPTTIASIRKYKDIDPAKFTNDVTNKLERALSTHMSADELVETYNKTLETTLEAHAPLKMKEITQHKKVLWFSDAIANEFRLHRWLEKCWRNDSFNRENFLQFYQQRWLLLNMLDQAERVYFHDVLHENRNNVKEIYNIVNKLLDRVKDLPLPPTNSNFDLANEFNDFFCNNITRIHDHLVSHNKIMNQFKKHLTMVQ